MTEDATLAEIDRLLGLGVNKAEVGRRVGATRSLVWRRAKKLLIDAIDEVEKEETSEEQPESSGYEFKEKGDEASVGLKINRQIKTLEELVEVCKVDTTQWRVESWECTAWNMVTKDKTKEAFMHQLYRVHAKLKRVAPKPFLDAMEALFKGLEKDAPRYILPPLPPPKDRPFLLEIDLYDVHFGNLCWAAETGDNDDLKISQCKYRNAVEDLMVRASTYPVRLVLMPVGNDLFHTDTLTGTTTAGTPQDCDGRYPKMVETVERSVIEACERILAHAAKLKIIYAPGNHDTLSSYHLCRTLAAWFRNCDRVEVDLSPRYRKYEQHGICLFGYTHGDHVSSGKRKMLPGLMAVENPDAWATSRCREFKLGHVHTSVSEEIMGVMVRHLSSLSGTNAWHFKETYVGNRKAAEAYLYSTTDGYVGHFIANART